MSCNAPDLVALEENLRQLQHRADDFALMLDFVRKYDLSRVFPELPNYLLTQAEIARQERSSLIDSALNASQPEYRYEVSVKDAAESLDVSEATIRNWDSDGCPFDQSYPGRFKSVVFYQWAVSYKSLRKFNRNAKMRAMALNKSV